MHRLGWSDGVTTAHRQHIRVIESGSLSSCWPWCRGLYVEDARVFSTGSSIKMDLRSCTASCRRSTVSTLKSLSLVTRMSGYKHLIRDAYVIVFRVTLASMSVVHYQWFVTLCMARVHTVCMACVHTATHVRHTATATASSGEWGHNVWCSFSEICNIRIFISGPGRPGEWTLNRVDGDKPDQIMYFI